jgi:DNA polymerase-3 subunit epsilon
MYAILDIETTGGQFNEEGITEIAIYKFDGYQVIDQFISLINPEKPIQPFVVKLTGINNAMLRSAPKFHEVAKRIVEITQDCIIVAHNALFDYRILRMEFSRLGYDFQAKTLCTVELSKILIPEQPSYSLGKLVRSLGIPVTDRHRANGDAIATVKLFKMLLEKDTHKNLIQEQIKTEIAKGIDTKLHLLLENLPNTVGVYYFYDANGTIFYIGKAKAIKKKVNQHFASTTVRNKKIQQKVCAVTYEETGSELLSILKELEEIKIHKPKLNQISEKSVCKLGLYLEKDSEGFKNLLLTKIDRRKKEIFAFISLQEANTFLEKILANYTLNQNHIIFNNKMLIAANLSVVSLEEHNQNVATLIHENQLLDGQKVLIDRGRTLGEKSVILFENGIFQGYAFVDLNYQIHNLSILKNIIVKLSNTKDFIAITQSYLQKNKRIKIISI